MEKLIVELYGVGQVATITQEGDNLVCVSRYPEIQKWMGELIGGYADKQLPLLTSMESDGRCDVSMRSVKKGEPGFLHALSFEINHGYSHGKNTYFGKPLLSRIV